MLGNYMKKLSMPNFSKFIGRKKWVYALPRNSCMWVQKKLLYIMNSSL